MIQLSISILIFAFLATTFASGKDNFRDVTELSPGIEVELRYFSDWNFLGRKVTGYRANKCLLTSEAATALAKAQELLSTQGLSILALDCYRPQRSVTEFLKWTQDAQDNKMQKVFYPDEAKATLVERGYISDKSGHSRGSTIDLTVVKKSSSTTKTGQLRYQEEASDCRWQKKIATTGQLDMGTTYDCFSTLANTANKNIPKAAQKNRLILKAAMEKAGFVNYSKEWWHYTLKNEPFKDQYFDFEVE